MSGPRPTELTPEAGPLHRWGAQLRQLREERGMSIGALARLIHCDRSYLARVERAERSMAPGMVAACDEHLGADGVLTRLHEEAVRGRMPASDGLGQDPNRVESARNGANRPINGANDAAIMAAGPVGPAGWTEDEDIVVPARTADGRVIFVAVSRRLLLQGLGTAAALAIPTAITTGAAAASALPATVPQPGSDPLRYFAQMRRVLIESDNLFGPRRVIPTVREQIAVMQRLREELRGADHHALLRVQTQYAELAGWLLQDLGDHASANTWLDRALQWSTMARDQDTTVYILARKSQLAGDTGDSTEAIDVAEAAIALTEPGSRLAAVAATYAAHGYALRGEHSGCLRAYDRAEQLLQAMDAEQATAWGSWFGTDYLAVHRARSMDTLGQYRIAADGYRDAIAGLPADYRRDQGVYLAREALALAGDREPEQAATLGMQALAIAADTHSGRTHTELTRLDDRLTRWDRVPEVGRFHEALAQTLPARA